MKQFNTIFNVLLTGLIINATLQAGARGGEGGGGALLGRAFIRDHMIHL